MRRDTIIASVLLAGASLSSAATCNADSCLSSLEHISKPAAFCATYTKPVQGAAPTAPAWAKKGCPPTYNADTPNRLSSACACLKPAPTTTSKKQTSTAKASTTSTKKATTTTKATGKPTVEPCAEVSKSWAAQMQTAPRKI